MPSTPATSLAADRAARCAQRHELAIKARLREATAAIESVRLAGPAFGLAHAGLGSTALNGWQHAQLVSIIDANHSRTPSHARRLTS
jgi:hypothetical protein